MAKTCPNCGASFQDDQLFCSQCGAASSEAETVVTGENPGSVTPQTGDLEKELSTKWLGTALLVSVAALMWVTLEAWWVIETTSNASQALRAEAVVDGRESGIGFSEGVSFAIDTFIEPMEFMTAFLLALSILGLTIHMSRLGLKHRNFGKMIRFGFALPGPWGVFSIGLGAVVLVVMPLLFVMPTLELMSASVGIRVPLTLRLAIQVSDFLSTWGGGLAAAAIVLFVAVRVRKRLSLKKGGRAR